MTFALAVVLALAQAPPAVDQTTNKGFVTSMYRGIKDFILRGADKMPAEHFEFKPTPDVRSFRDLYEHYGNMVTYMRLKGIVPPSSEPRPSGN